MNMDIVDNLLYPYPTIKKESTILMENACERFELESKTSSDTGSGFAVT